jgi:hypothetical protein
MVRGPAGLAEPTRPDYQAAREQLVTGLVTDALAVLAGTAGARLAAGQDGHWPRCPLLPRREAVCAPLKQGVTLMSTDLRPVLHSQDRQSPPGRLPDAKRGESSDPGTHSHGPPRSRAPACWPTTPARSCSPRDFRTRTSTGWPTISLPRTVVRRPSASSTGPSGCAAPPLAVPLAQRLADPRGRRTVYRCPPFAGSLWAGGTGAGPQAQRAHSGQKRTVRRIWMAWWAMAGGRDGFSRNSGRELGTTGRCRC